MERKGLKKAYANISRQFVMHALASIEAAGHRSKDTSNSIEVHHRTFFGNSTSYFFTLV